MRKKLLIPCIIISIIITFLIISCITSHKIVVNEYPCDTQDTIKKQNTHYNLNILYYKDSTYKK